jgi:hypothetical protein
MTGKVFTKPIILQKDVDAELAAWFENIDNAGRHLNVFARDVFKIRCSRVSVSFTWTCPRRAARRWSAGHDRRRTASRNPSVPEIHPARKPDRLEIDHDCRRETLTQIRIKECVTEPDPANGAKRKSIKFAS